MSVLMVIVSAVGRRWPSHVRPVVCDKMKIVIDNRLCFMSANYVDCLQCSDSMEGACWRSTSRECQLSWGPLTSSVGWTRYYRGLDSARKNLAILVVFVSIWHTLCTQVHKQRMSILPSPRRLYFCLSLFVYQQDNSKFD